VARFKKPRNNILGRAPIVLLVCFNSLAQTTETPHQTVQRVKGIGLSAETVDQVEPLLEKAVQGWADLNPRDLEYAQALSMLGMVRQFFADVDIPRLRNNVEPIYKKALSVYDRSIVAPAPSDLALTLELEAGVLNAIGEVQEATFLSERAITIRKERVREIQEGAPRMTTAYKPGEGISAPTISARSEPAYTSEARFLRVQGAVGLRFVVDEKGLPQDISLVQSLGYGLDENAVRAVRTWRFLPGKDESGKPLPTILNMEITFKPESPRKP
jgi:TonB family protein